MQQQAGVSMVGGMIGRPQQPQGQLPPPQWRARPPVPAPPTATSTAQAAQMALMGVGPLTATTSAIGPALLKLLAFNESMALAYQREDINDLRAVVEEFFTKTGIVKYGLFDTENHQSKLFEIPCSALPRFQHINLISGITTTNLHPAFIREFVLTTPSPITAQPVHVGFLLLAEKATWVSHFDNGIFIELRGSLKVHFVVVEVPGGAGGEKGAGLRIESMEFSSRGHGEFVSKGVIINDRVEKLIDLPAATPSVSTSPPAATPAASAQTGKARPARKAAPRRRSTNKEEPDSDNPLRVSTSSEDPGLLAAQGLGAERPSGLVGVDFQRFILPNSPVGSFGITEMGMRCLEIAESVAQLQDLIQYSLETSTGPLESLAHFTAQRRSSPPAMAHPSHAPHPSYSSHPSPLPLPPTPTMVSGIPLAPHPRSAMDGPPSASLAVPGGGGGIGIKSQNASANSFYSSNSPSIPTSAPLPVSIEQHQLQQHQLQQQHHLQQQQQQLQQKKRKLNAAYPTAALNGVITNTLSTLGVHIPRTPTPDELAFGPNGTGIGEGSAGLSSTPGGSIGINIGGGLPVGMGGSAGRRRDGRAT